MSTYFGKGLFNAICDVCGRKFKSNQLSQRWDGMMVCRQDKESRHPMDFFKGAKEDLSIPWNRHEQADTFINVNYIDLSTLPNFSPNTSNQHVPPPAPGPVGTTYTAWNSSNGWGVLLQT